MMLLIFSLLLGVGLIGAVLQADNINFQGTNVNENAQNFLTVNGAINPSIAAQYVITKAGVLADTLAAPVAGTDDGKLIKITSFTANAHTLTTVGLLNTGSASVNVATFAAFAGAGLVIMAIQGKWNVISSVGITFS